MPTIGIVHCWNFLLTLFALCLHCLFHFLITVLLPDVKFLPEKNLSSLLKRYQPKEMVLLSFDPQNFSSINEELSPSIPIEDNLELLNQSPQQQFIIEMEPIIIENDSKIQQQPSTSTQQFEAVELEEISQPTIEPSKPNSDPLKRTSNSKKSLLSFGSGVFRSKEVKNEKRIVTPFKGISIDNDSLKLENGKNEIKEEEDKQILINTEEELNIIEENDETKIGKKLIKKIKEEKTPLEKELTIIRQLIFYFYLIVSIILIFVLIF